MGKSINGLGKFQGKVGAVVFSIRNGQQIIREYNPNVANPKTVDQSLQRAKTNLVGQISHVIKNDLIVGLNGGSKSGRRSQFLKNLYSAVTATESNGDFSAELLPADLKLSDGDKFDAMRRDVSGIILESNELSISWLDGTGAAGVKVKVVVLCYIGEGMRYTGSPAEWVVLVSDEVNSTARNVIFDLGSSFVGSGNSFQVYAYGIPTRISGSVADAQTEPMVGNPEDIAANLNYSTSAAREFGESVYLGAAYVNY